MDSDQARAIRRLTREQSGVVRRHQLHALGIPPRSLRRHVAEGRWERAAAGVLVLPGTADDPVTRALVVAQAVFPAGVLTGWSALAVQGLLGQEPWDALPPEPRPWLRVNGHRRVAAKVIRVRRPGSSRTVRGVPVAPPDVVTTDLLRHLPPDEARTQAFRLAQARGSAKLTRLLTATADAAPTARGARQLRVLALELSSGAHSDAEQLLVQLLTDAGFAGFIVNYPVAVRGREFRVDVAFPDSRLAVEVDGRAFHSDRQRFQHDRTRQNLLMSEHWRVLRFTWEDLTERPEQCLAQIVAMLRA